MAAAAAAAAAGAVSVSLRPRASLSVLSSGTTSSSFSSSPPRLGAKFSAVMASPTLVPPAIAPVVIVGCGRVGQMFQSLGDGRDVVVSRGQQVPADFDGPILVCTRNDDLESVLDATPPSRWKDLVFFQNGMLEPWLESKGLRNADQVLAYFAISKRGEAPVDGKTDTNPEGLTAAYGRWASAVATRLHHGGLSCKVLEKESFQVQMLEKLIWISSFMLVGARHNGATVGIVEREYRTEVASLIAELATAASAEKGIIFEEGMVDRLCAYSRAVAHFPTAVKEFKWRNGWFYSLTEKALAEGKADPCPLHTAWLKELNMVSTVLPNIYVPVTLTS